VDSGKCHGLYRTLLKKRNNMDPKHPMHFNKIKKQDAWEEMGNFEKVPQANVRITTSQET
jgi:hypothetical protein